MSYYQALGLVREPFSNGPEPELFYRAPGHLACLQGLEIAARLRRGLCVVCGEPGTGKTVLCRELARLLGADEAFTVLVLDAPTYATPGDFLTAVARSLDLDDAVGDREPGALREAIKAQLRRRAQAAGRTLAVLVDEGQALSPACLELLRDLLNFETDTGKLLQLVIFAQPGFAEQLATRPDLADRVQRQYRLRPLDRRQTRRLIETRLALCAPAGPIPAVFTPLAMRRIHRLTGGFPRKIVRLCHLSLLLAVGSDRRRVDWRLVGQAAREAVGANTTRLPRWVLASGGVVAGVLLGLVLLDQRLPRLAGLTKAAVAFESPAEPAKVVPQPLPLPVASEAKPLPPTADAPLLPPSPALPSPVRAVETATAVVASGPETPPETLGSVAVRRGWAVSRLVAHIYGNGGRRVLPELAKANPGKNLSKLRIGDALVYPALATTAPASGTYLVRVASLGDLGQGVAYLSREQEKNVVRLSLFCTASPGAGLRFDVVLPTVFADRATAKAALASLPRELAGRAALVAGYPDGTVYFTELTGGAGHGPSAAPVSGRQVAERQALGAAQ